MRRCLVGVLSALLVAFAIPAAPAMGAHQDFLNLSLEFFDPNTERITSDIAFWGDTAFVGNYGGLRTYDISHPDDPSPIRDFKCFGPQNDPSVWDTDGDGEADLLVQSDDLTLDAPACGSPQSRHPDGSRHDENPTGWEGIRLFDVSDPANPVFLDSIYLDCGSHTKTMYPDLERDRLVVLISSYPLRPGPTCGISHEVPTCRRTCQPLRRRSWQSGRPASRRHPDGHHPAGGKRAGVRCCGFRGPAAADRLPR